MAVPRKLLATAAVGAGLVGADIATVRRWHTNPDPLEGEVPRFPDGDTIVVPTDDGAELRVMRAGEGPTVVLVHGITSNADDWGPVARRLVERGFRVVGVNQRGHHDSTIGTDGFTAARLARDVREVLTALDLHDVVLVGHSMGGIASMSFALDHPDDLHERVRGLCLVATIARTNSLEGRAGISIIAARPNTASGGNSETVDRLRRRVARLVFGRRPNWDLLGHAVATGLRCNDDTRISAAKGLLTYDIVDRLPDIDIPTTVICGTYDLITRYPKSVAIAEAISDARMVTVPGGGHMLLWETPDLLADEIGALATVG